MNILEINHPPPLFHHPPLLFQDSNQAQISPSNINQLNIDSFTNRRAILLENLQANSCSYTCTFDLLNNLNNLNKLGIRLHHAPDLLPVLKRKPPTYARFSKAITNTQALVQSNYNIVL